VASATLEADRALTVGRDDSCELQVDHPSVSRRHLVLRRTSAGVIAEDLGSRNGTYVGDLRLERRSPRELAGSLSLRLGEALLLVQRAACSDRTRERGHALDEQLLLLAAGDVPLVLQGEYGVGKRTLAGRIHGASPRRAQVLVSVDCVGVDELELLEAVLAAFDEDASRPAARVPRDANGPAGTLVLTDVHELSPSLQARLVRILTSEPSASRVHVIATTCSDLEAMTRSGAFRLDLFHRLAGHVAVVPPLRDRPDEVEVHARTLAAAVGEARGTSPPAFSSDALAALRRHAWPGNMPELRNVVTTATLLALEGVIRVEHLGPRFKESSARGPLRSEQASTSTTTMLRGELSALERRRILEALDRCAGNQTRAAKLLGIGRRTLLKRLDAYGITRPRRGKE
jgi:DNA-binding NtrC family response regulator